MSINLKSKALLVLALLYISVCPAQSTQWAKIPGRISSPWSEKVDPQNPLPEYPRPQLTRAGWTNLNGLWNYSITAKNATDAGLPGGKILVPFAIESSLSGVGKTVGKDSLLWYNRKFSIRESRRGKKVLLHFGAVDWKTDVWVNGKKAGTHEGGYDPFTFDITTLVGKSKEQNLTISVWDPTDEGPQPRGKQVKSPEGIWYTPVTGIWQTVWLEVVPETYISYLKSTPDIDRQTLSVSVSLEGARPGDKLKVTAMAGGAMVSEAETDPGGTALLTISNPQLWSPASPFLYDLQVKVIRNKKEVDAVKSYFAMRKSSIGTDNNGVKRMALNNKFVFQYGPLDQGWWPDGLYTAPTDEALKFDIEKTKEMGFNMIRKHTKVEPARWYYHCDQLGILVWQDMPSGDLGNHWDSRPGVAGLANDKNRTAESEKYYRREWNAIMDALYPFPSIVVWTPFNEGWGQFKTPEIAGWTKTKDPSRLVNSASGGNFYYVDDIIDLHNYPAPAMPEPAIFGTKQAIVLGEFGGLGLPVKDHLWQEKDSWGYQTFKTPEALFEKYSTFVDTLQSFIKRGLSAAVYTQTTDVEVEINGLMTYDRKILKNPAEKLNAVNRKLYDPTLVNMAAPSHE